MEAAAAIVESIWRRQGRQFAVVFSRQSGKDELLAQLIAFLLHFRCRSGGQVVVAAPTFLPQAALTRDRLVERLQQTGDGKRISQRNGYVVGLGRANARFLSASPEANARGQTADLLLVANEAQDIDPDTWDAVFDPMAVSTNATTLFMGTVWNRDSLLSRQIRFLEEQSAADNVQRVFRADWERVAAEHPQYGERVRQRIEQFGASHPFIRTEYFLQELDGEDGLFPPNRLAQMQGTHPRRVVADPGCRYALLIDVAGEEEERTGGGFSMTARRDSTALTVVQCLVMDGQTHYQVVDRMAWTGERHVLLHDQLVDLARNCWHASAVVIDATGIGAGLAAFLKSSLEERGRERIKVMPFVFNAATKSDLGWRFLALIDSGRFKEYADDSHEGTQAARLTAAYWSQLRAIRFETGAGQRLRWGARPGAGHDDLVLSAALVGALEEINWNPRIAVGRPPTGW